MRIELVDAGKRFNYEWIFRHIQLRLETGSSMAILGGNGSGKSTLLRIISGYFSLSEGSRAYSAEGTVLDPDQLYHHLSIAAPYLDLPGLFTLRESIDFHFSLKPIVAGISKEEIPGIIGLEAHLNKQVRNFSSGMKQRLKLGLAICSDTPLLLLDEPASNLDAKAVEWYRDTLDRFKANRTLVVASNHDPQEYDMCRELLDLNQLKAAQG